MFESINKGESGTDFVEKEHQHQQWNDGRWIKYSCQALSFHATGTLRVKDFVADVEILVESASWHYVCSWLVRL